MANLVTVFENTVRQFGSRVAVEVQRKDGLDRFTYDELSRLRLDRARQLRDCGVGAGDRCAILAHNDAHWCAAYLGILTAGAIVVPFDTNYSAAQVATILRDAGVRVLFAGERLRDVAEAALADMPGVALLDIHAPVDAAAPESSAPALSDDAAAVPESATAVILYTSGTTSDPKGVMLSHANLIAERDGAFAVVDVSADDSVLGVLPLFHSLAQLANLLLPFAVGARVVYLETLSSQELVRALSERRISVFACVPQFFYLIHERIMREVEKRGAVARLIFRALMALNFRLRRLGVNLGPMLFGKVHDLLGRQMRFFVTGGSKFEPAIGRDLYALGFTILQAYGLTETSGAATISAPHEAHLDTVGRAFPGTEVTVLPPEGELDGEIAIRGPLVMQGYYARPEATAAVMRDGWFLTGDLGRFDEAGRLAITGRKKEVIILANGKNLYPEEIEAHYRQSPFVKELAVTTMASGTDKPAGERLYAVVVPDMDLLRQKKIVNAGDVLRFEFEGLSATLPSYKRVLGYEVSFEPLPRTTTGKLKRHEIERRLARAAEVAAGQAPAPGEAPVWPDDEHVSSVLGIVRRRVGEKAVLAPAANLELDLGLDSMERVELLTELEQATGRRVPEEESQQIYTLGQLVDAVRPTGAETGLAAGRASSDMSWSVLLDDLPPSSDPVLGRLLESRPFVEPLLFLLSRVFRGLVVRTSVTGVDRLPATGAYLICPNHQSYVDSFCLYSVLPYRTLARLFFVGAVEYFETPLMTFVARKINCVPVDSDSNLVPAMKAGAFGLAHGKILVLFPEGERSIDGAVKRFKKGAPILSRHLDAPIVPVAIRGAHEAWPRGQAFNWRALVPFGGVHVRITIGEPFSVRADESDGEAAERLRAEVQRMWDAERC